MYNNKTIRVIMALYNRGDIMKKCGESNKVGIVDAKQLACYISNYYSDKFNDEITPIKLQKSLYFCFAYWGGFVKRSKLPYTEVTIEKSDWLFNQDIEAWVYGPVVPDVYHEENLSEYNNPDIFKGNEDVMKYINGILDDVLAVSDFKLVEVSHMDNCWKKNFDINSEFHNKVIDKEDIIEEYAKIF